ncbi:citryl-CoA lyase [Labrys okinawensis]|uniref:citrate synthase (unknown stereospecificity) n=1 Tax=Labrys okinawensis TaxID=346911 RepID=A0A2S9QJW5_9HYPH|nr:citryl-CoA lyase [Labrys okinawensis]PRH89644.1 citryl-CoA lyase [Labrys okinawensis]
MDGVKTEIGYTTADQIVVRGADLSTEILGKFDFVDMIYWLNFARRPEERERAMVNAILVAATDHGLTPSAIASRLTLLGAPESVQGAVAAGLLGAGGRFLGTIQNVSELLTSSARDLPPEASETDIAETARQLVQRQRQARSTIPGVGHPIHVGGDPRVEILRRISRDNGYFGKHWRLALAIPKALEETLGKRLPLNAAGALGAMISDMGFDSVFGRGLILVGRAAGLIAHLREETETPIAANLWELVLEQDPRNGTGGK